MHLSLQLCGLLLYTLVSTASSQEKERLWHSTTPGPTTTPTGDPSPSPLGVLPVENVPVAAGPAGETGPIILKEVVAPAESPTQFSSIQNIQTSQDVLNEEKLPVESKTVDPLAEEGKEDKERKWISAPKEEAGKKENTAIEDSKAEKKERKWISASKEEVLKEENTAKEDSKEEKKDRKWISAPKEVREKSMGAEVKEEEENGEVKEEKKDRKWMSALKEEDVKVPKEETKVDPKKQTVTLSVEESENDAAEVFSEESNPKKKKKQPRKWISVPGMVIDEEPTAPMPTKDDSEIINESLDLTKQSIADKPLKSSEFVPQDNVDPYAINALDMDLPANITELLMAAEDGVPLVQETIISKKTTVYVTISDSVDAEPLFVNLTGIRHYTGQERRMMAGLLDLSDLMITGEDAKEVIQRMSKHRFHRIDLSNNNITEFPANTFSPVAFTVRELRLDGNPLASNDQGEASVLQRGGLFHLTELRELNLSGCGLQDMDYFTPWNSNHLEVVDLSNNKLTAIPSNLQFFHKLKKLFLDGNPITRVTELPFALLWNMQVLSLADCQVASIADDPFRNMDKLKELSLEGNNLTQIGHVRLPRSNSAVKMFLSSNPWHCACEMLNFIEHYHYAIRDIEYIRCASPRWLEGLRTAYLTKEILSLDSVDGDCTPQTPRVSSTHTGMPDYPPTLRADRLQLLALIVFVMGALIMLWHVLWARKRDKYKFEEDRDDIHYIRIEKKPNFK